MLTFKDRGQSSAGYQGRNLKDLFLEPKELRAIVNLRKEVNAMVIELVCELRRRQQGIQI